MLSSKNKETEDEMLRFSQENAWSCLEAGFSLISVGGIMIFHNKKKNHFRHFASGEVRLTFAAFCHQRELCGKIHSPDRKGKIAFIARLNS